jgi:hypothetical protein
LIYQEKILDLLFKKIHRSIEASKLWNLFTWGTKSDIFSRKKILLKTIIVFAR